MGCLRTDKKVGGGHRIKGVARMSVAEKIKTSKFKYILVGLLVISIVFGALALSYAAETSPMVAAGGNHTVALKSDGTVWTWGYNSSGQLGDGTMDNKSTPVQVQNLGDVVSVAAGYHHTVALKSDGTVWTWGRNSNGQLGDGTTTNRSAPVQTPNINLGIDPAKPVKPTNVQASISGKTVTLSWDGPGDATYVIQRSTDGEAWDQVPAVIGTTLTETAPLWDTTYQYRIAQKGRDGRISDFSEPVQITIGPVPVPAYLTASREGNSVNLSWQAVAVDITAYVIEKSADNETWETLTAVTDTTSCTDQVIDNASYFYRVRADGGNNQISEPSNVVEVTVPPDTPTNLRVSASGRTVSLVWDASEGATAYVIQRSTDGTTFEQVAEATEAIHTDTVPNWNTLYHYRVLAKSSIGYLSGPSSAVQIKTPPAPPAVLRAEVSYNTISLTWNASAGANSYTVQRSTEGSEWTEIGTISDTSYTDENLDWGRTFQYRVFARTADGLVSDDSTVTATIGDVPVPTNLTASLEGTDAVLYWQSVPYINTYIVERSLSGQDWEFYAEVQNTTYTDIDLDLSNDYYYRVKSHGGNRVSEPSNIVKVTTAPGVPTNLQANVSGKTVALSWEGSGNVTYIIQRGTDGITFEQVAEVIETTYTDAAPRWEATYWYRILAKNSDAMISDPSEPIRVLTTTIPVPANLQASVSENSITLTWDAASDISQYRIERSESGVFWGNLAEVSDTTYTDSNLEWETNYFYRIRSLDGDQVSKPCDHISAKTTPKPVPTAPRLAYSVNNQNVGVSWNYQEKVDGYRVYIDEALVTELSGSKTNHSFTGERGHSYKIRVEAHNIYGTTSSTITVKVSELATPEAGEMVGDIAKNVGLVGGGMGGLLALALALKASPWLLAAAKAAFLRFF